MANAILDGTDYVMLSGESKRSETDVDIQVPLESSETGGQVRDELQVVGGERDGDGIEWDQLTESPKIALDAV